MSGFLPSQLTLPLSAGSVSDSNLSSISKIGKLDLTLDPTTGLATDSSVLTTSGLGTYLRTTRRVAALGTAGDSAALQALIAEMSGVGELYLTPGSYLIRSPLQFRLTGAPYTKYDRVTITMHPNAVLIGQMLVSNGYSNSVIQGFGSGGPNNLLTDDVVYGAVQFKCAAVALLAVGSLVQLSAPGARVMNLQTSYVVRGITGPVGGKYTVTVDRPIDYPFVANDYASWLDPVDRVTIRGGTIQGTGDRAIELGQCLNPRIEDVRIISAPEAWNDGAARSGTGFPIGFAFDDGCCDAIATGVRIDDQAGTLALPVMIESNANPVLEDLVIRGADLGAVTAAIFVYHSRGVSIRNPQISGTHDGILINPTSLGAPSFDQDGEIVGGKVEGCAGAALHFADGARGWSARCSALNFNAIGVLVDAPGGTGASATAAPETNAGPIDVSLDGLRGDGNARDIQMDAGKRVEARGCHFVVRIVQGATRFAVLQNAGELAIHGCTWRYPDNAAVTACNPYCIGTVGGSRLYIGERTRVLDETGGHAGAVSVRGVYSGASTAIIEIGEGVDTSTCWIPFKFDGSAVINFGSITANGAGTAQEIASWTDAKVNDFLDFRLTIIGGTPTPHAPLVTVTTGKFSVTFAAGDTSTYSWKARRGHVFT